MKSLLMFLPVVLILDVMTPLGNVAAQDDPFVAIPAELDTQVEVQAAYNGEDIVWRFRWPAKGNWYHDMLVYQDGRWVRHGASQVGSQPDGIYEDRLTFLVDPGTVNGFANQGCYLTCHAGSRFLNDQLPPETIGAHPYLGEQRGVSDLRKYIPASRSAREAWWRAPWDRIKPQSALDDLAARGVFLDLWHWRAHRSDPMGYADDQHVLEYRNGDAGKGPYTTNWDSEAKRPKWMFDADKTGFVALDWDDLRNRRVGQDEVFALTTENSVPFDPERSWQEGDVIPRRLVRVPEGSRGTIRADGRWSEGTWTLVLRRAMDTGHPTDDHALLEGRVYNIGFAVHKDATGSRWHYISLPQQVGIGTPADITAVRFSGATPDWSQVPRTTVPLWYPAQITWEWLTSDAHPGAPQIRDDTRACASCHGNGPAAVRKLAEASAYHESGAGPLRLNWWLTLVAVLAVIVGGTIGVMKLSWR